MKIVFLDSYAANPGDLSWEPLQAFGEYIPYERTPFEKTVEWIGNAEAVFVNDHVLTREAIESCPNIKFIGAAATGYNNIDLAAAKERKIAVANIPGYSSDAVAQHVFAHILDITNEVAAHARAVSEGLWYEAEDCSVTIRPLTLLHGKSIGIIGYGNIGKRVAEIAKAFGMNVNIYSRDKDATIKSDFLSLNCPLTKENRGLVNSEFINKMKDGAVIINTARGALINENDLADALKSGKISAAGIDVLSTEPPREKSPLIGLPNCRVTPHNAWMPKETRQKVIDICAANLKSFLDGGTLNRVDLP